MPSCDVVTENTFRLTNTMLLLPGYIKSFIKYMVKSLGKKAAKFNKADLALRHPFRKL